MTKIVTIFRNIAETSTPFHVSASTIIDRIRDGKSKDLVKKIRKNRSKTERNELKKELPAICFSGRFNKRADDAIVAHSGLICLDFDGYKTARDMLNDKELLTKDKYVYSVFISPSGNGLKVLVKIPEDIDNHVLYFNSLEAYFDSDRFDTTSKNISRVCYESYDPLIFLNENSSIWTDKAEPEYVEITKYRDAPTIPITDENKIVDILVKWWTRKYPMVEGQRNQNVFILAMALNDFGVSKGLAEYILNQYATNDFKQSEIKRTIDSAYRNTDKFGSKYYEDEDRINDIKQRLRRGTPKKEIKRQLESEDIEPDVAEAVINKVDLENSKQAFWYKTDKGIIKIIHIQFKQFLEDNGFFKYSPEESNNYVFVRVKDNLVDHTSEKELKDFVLNHLLELDDYSIYNYFADNTRFFKEEFLSMLSTIDIYFIGDTKGSAYLYYRNCAVKVTGREIRPIDYIDLGGYVWKDHVIDRNFELCGHEGCDYGKFISNICGRDKSRTESMESTIGFMLHGHKNLSYCPAVILNDEVISDNPEGGTGKGIFMNALSHMKKVVTIDGKSVNFERAFAYQLVSADTQVLVFDDVKKNFPFERLFSVITEGITLEKKNKDAIKIPFERSPKIGITTNYAIKGAGNSFARRKWELELHQYYTKTFTPLDDFGRMMFGEWDDDEWCRFDNYMVSCLQSYLKTGLIESEFVNLKIRQLSAETSHDFIEWCGFVDGQEDDSPMASGMRHYKNDLYDDFISEYPDYAPKAKFTISRTRFYRWVAAYALHRFGVPPEEGRDAQGRWVRFRTRQELEVNGKFNF